MHRAAVDGGLVARQVERETADLAGGMRPPPRSSRAGAEDGADAAEQLAIEKGLVR